MVQDKKQHNIVHINILSRQENIPHVIVGVKLKSKELRSYCGISHVFVHMVIYHDHNMNERIHHRRAYIHAVTTNVRLSTFPFFFFA
jgi:hypothetical protein